MLTCKEFVEQSYKIHDAEIKLTLMQRINFAMHRFICIHCMRFFKQYQLLNDTCQHFPKQQVAQGHLDQAVEQFRRLNK